VEFRNAIVEKFERDNNLIFSPDQIVVSNGAKQSIANVCQALLNEGDEVIIFTPYWVSYYEIVKYAGGVPICVSANIDQDYKVTPDQVKKAISHKTKAVIFSSPCNPTGSVYSFEELAALAEVLSQKDDLIIISDEIYEYINFSGSHASIGAIDSVKNRTVTINGMSKGFAMTGWRLGYMGAPAWIASACSKVQSQVTSGAASFSQMAAAHGLKSDLSPTFEMTKAFEKRKKLVLEGLSEIPGMKLNNPMGAFYVFPDISEYFGKTNGKTIIDNSIEFCEILLEEAHVATVAGSAFGADDCFRISYAASEKDLMEAIKRIKKTLSTYF
jgi:aspartate aminotransferase